MLAKGAILHAALSFLKTHRRFPIDASLAIQLRAHRAPNRSDGTLFNSLDTSLGFLQLSLSFRLT